jgi:alkanesulfonate monooxygenase SsuD/methylene tetrahydromethanopterin reductase-like flavin-dependent oxidoreductase (luciferase family)
MGFGPNGRAIYGDALDKGFARRTDGKGRDFEIFTGCSVHITDDVKSVLDGMRPLTGMYVGGMGSATHNYHREAMARRGFPDAAARIHELWLAGRKQEAIEAVPDEYLEQTALVGSEKRIRERWHADFAGCGATGVIVRSQQPEAFDLLAELAGTQDRVEAN